MNVKCLTFLCISGILTFSCQNRHSATDSAAGPDSDKMVVDSNALANKALEKDKQDVVDRLSQLITGLSGQIEKIESSKAGSTQSQIFELDRQIENIKGYQTEIEEFIPKVKAADKNTWSAVYDEVAELYGRVKNGVRPVENSLNPRQ